MQSGELSEAGSGSPPSALTQPLLSSSGRRSGAVQGRSEVGVFKDGLSSGKLEERRRCVCSSSHTNEAGLPAQVGWTGLERIHNHLLLLHYCLPPGVIPSGYVRLCPVCEGSGAGQAAYGDWMSGSQPKKETIYKDWARCRESTG